MTKYPYRASNPVRTTRIGNGECVGERGKQEPYKGQIRPPQGRVRRNFESSMITEHLAFIYRWSCVMRRGAPVRTWTAPSDLPPGDDLRKCFRSLLHRLELESGCTRAKIEESAKVRQRIQQEKHAKPEPLRVYKNGSSAASREKCDAKGRQDTPGGIDTLALKHKIVLILGE